MKFSELKIQTQRAAPFEIRAEGLAFLYRAGYVSRSLEIMPLGQLAIGRLRSCFSVLDNSGGWAEMMAEFLTSLKLNPLKSHENSQYYVAIEKGAEKILHCPGCGYAARHEQARVNRQPLTPEELLPVEKIYTPDCNTIVQLADFLQISPEKTAKALMFTRLQDGKFVFVVVRGDMQLSDVKLKAHCGAVRLATADEITASGAVAGYASPIGLQNTLVIVDDVAARAPNLAAGANEKGYHLLNTNHGRDYQADIVADLVLANRGDFCPVCSTPLEMLDAEIVSADGEIDFEKLLRVLAEIHHDDKGLTLPTCAAPFDVYLMNVPGKILNTALAAESLYAQLSSAGFSVLFDDRDERAGVKFNDADLIGCPVRVTVGERGLQNGMIELKQRIRPDNQLIPGGDVVKIISVSL